MKKRKEKVLRFISKVLSKFFTKKAYAKIIFKAKLGYKLNLKDPQTFCEKLNWLKLYYLPHNELAVKCTDKYLVREYVESMGLGEHLVELYGDWDDARKIDFEKLPDQFVLKVTNGQGYNIICKDKKSLNIPHTVKQLNKWLKEDFGALLAEPHYSKLKGKGRIIAEKFLEDDISDYKFFFFHGELEYMYIATGIVQKDIRHSYFDKSGSPAPFKRPDRPGIENCVLPVGFEKMKKLSSVLAKEFPFVRVDWFEVNGKIYFSELTFTHAAGLAKFDPPEYDRKLGDLLDLETVKQSDIYRRTHEKRKKDF